jgi:hypothetical protein
MRLMYNAAEKSRMSSKNGEPDGRRVPIIWSEFWQAKGPTDVCQNLLARTRVEVQRTRSLFRDSMNDCRGSWRRSENRVG